MDSVSLVLLKTSPLHGQTKICNSTSNTIPVLWYRNFGLILRDFKIYKKSNFNWNELKLATQYKNMYM